MLVLLVCVKCLLVSETLIRYICRVPTTTASTAMTFDAAVGVAVNQYLLTHNLTRAQVGAFLGVAGSNISQRLRGRITWPAEDLFKLAQAFGVTVDDLMPRWSRRMAPHGSRRRTRPGLDGKRPPSRGAAGARGRCPGQDSNLRPSAPEADALSTELPGPEAELYQCEARRPKPGLARPTHRSRFVCTPRTASGAPRSGTLPLPPQNGTPSAASGAGTRDAGLIAAAM